MTSRSHHIAIVLIAIVSAVAVITTAFFFAPKLFGGIDDHILRSESIVTILSPEHRAQLVLTVNDQCLTYRVERDGKTFMEDSAMGLAVGEDLYGPMDSVEQIGKIRGRIVTPTREILGRTAVADTPCVQASIDIDAATPFSLDIRVFDNGVAFRYRLPDNGHRSLKYETTQFAVPDDTAVWGGESHPYYESINKYYDPTKVTNVALGTPATLKIGDKGYAAILEGDLKDYPGLKLDWLSPNTYGASLGSGTHTVSGEITTPWRIIAVADDLNELVNNTIVYQVCEPADNELYGDAWVKPGRATWSWITGRTADSVTPKALENYTDYAARLGFEYNIIDEGWVDWSGSSRRLDELAAQGEEYGVGQILWTGVTTGASFGGKIRSVDDARAFIDFLDEHGMAGGKIDFFPEENNVAMGVNIYREILAYAAQKELVINFHGCNKPTGYDTTYPNELNREAILGLESTEIQNRRVQAQMFVTQPFVRNLAGHADYTPAVDTSFHMAQLVLTDAPMQAIGSDPKTILQSPALEMIKSVPTVWEQTVVLPQSRIGQTAVIARQGALGSWYVGGINNLADGDELTLDLSTFLGEGTYRCELWTDQNGKPVCDVTTVTADDTLNVPFSALSGFIARFDRVTLSQYGGEIDKAITIDVTDPDTAVAYSFDNGDGPSRFRTVVAGEPIELTESGVLTVKIKSGPDKGMETAYRFNLL